MISPTVLAQLSVQEFFQDCNWQGRAIQLELSTETLSDPAYWLSVSLGEFLSHSNWKGKRSQVHTQPNKEPSLTLPVTEYFQFMVWEARPVVAVVPEIPRRISEVTEEFRVTDLSDLF